MHDNAPAGRISRLRSRTSARLDPQLLCDHLHDRDHIRHLYAAGLVCAVNIVMTIGVPVLGLQLLVTFGIFGHDVLSILLT